MSRQEHLQETDAAMIGCISFPNDDQIATRENDSPLLNPVPVGATDVIQTPRLALRHFVETDLDPMAELMANPDFMRFSSGVFDRKRTAEFLFGRVIAPARQGLPSLFAVIRRGENRLIGYCGFLRQEVDDTLEIEIGYRLHPDYWNQGLATEAARAVRDYAFTVLRLERVISLIHPDNHASRRVTEKNGMMLEKKTTFRGFPTLVFSAMRAP